MHFYLLVLYKYYIIALGMSINPASYIIRLMNADKKDKDG
jgi:hypothetical protein